MRTGQRAASSFKGGHPWDLELHIQMHHIMTQDINAWESHLE